MTASPITDFDDPEQTRIPKGMDVQEQPREFTNPQTAAFCDLLQISNAFDLSEEERQARREAGPRPEVHYDRPGKRQFSGPRGPGGGMRGGGYDRRPSRGRGRGGSGGGRRH
ncbi:hypothetical protein KEM52_006032 [Ascosphaera acerosa]|nr:hypothetical protein KEM52_006032 [Ascosphaera acerosa]